MKQETNLVEVAALPKSVAEVAPESDGATATGAIVDAIENINARIGRRRWMICALLFFATTINYIDRQVIGILKPTLQAELGWTETDYGNIVFWFQAAYAVGLLVVGRVMDYLGTRRGFTFAIVFWSIAGAAHALASSVMGFSAARFALGLGEAGNFPASIKTIAEWFPKKERALATGIFNSGTNIGAIITPLAVPWITYHYGWRAAFVATGALGFVWLAFWLAVYRRPADDKRLGAPELAHINSDPEESVTPIKWRRLLPLRQTWAFALGKFLTDPIWYLYLFWLPDFLGKTYGLNLKTIGAPLIAIYLIADVGSIGGGWLSSAFIKRGWSVNAGRKTAMLICAVCVVPVGLAAYASNVWLAVALVGLAAAAHQGWSANIFTLVSDMFPRRAVGSVVGIGGMAGAVGGMFIAKLTGYILDTTGSYIPVFIIAASAYLFALLVIHLLAPRLAPAPLDDEAIV